MKPVLLIFLFFNLICYSLFAFQTDHTTDSLKKLVAPFLNNPSQKADTVIINRLNHIANDYYEESPDSTFYYSGLAIRLSKQLGYKKGLADGYSQIADVYSFRGDYQTAAINFNTALRLYRQTHDLYGCSEAYIGLGSVRDYLGDYKQAILYYDSALTIRQQTGSERKLAECYNIIGVTYDNMGEYSKALDCYFKALSISIKHKDELSAADNYCNIGVVMQHLELYPKALSYANTALNIWLRLNDTQGISTAWLNIGEALMAQKNYEKAKLYFDKAAAIFYRMKDQEGISLLYYDLGLYKYHQRQPDSALYYLRQSLQLASRHKLKYNKANAYLGFAQVYNQEKDFGNAHIYALLCQNVANSIGTLNLKAEAALQLSIALAGLGRFEEAYHQRVSYHQLSDSLKNDENVQELISYNLEVDFKKKQAGIAIQQRKKEALYKQQIAEQNQTNLIGTLVIAALLIMVVIYYRGRRKQQRINKLLAESNRAVLLQKTDLDKQAENLNELNTLKDRLIALLAHDLRAPISTLRGLFALMSDNAITHEELVEMVPHVVNKLDHTSDFLDTLLHWVNSQVSQSTDNIKVFNLPDVVNTELLYMGDQLKQKNIGTRVNIAPDVMAYADPNSIRIVIHNILTNAVKFSGRDTVIEIAGQMNDDGTTVLTIKDKGIGMSSEQLSSLFKSKVNSFPGTENEVGTGMGLFFCKDLVEKHSGHIWAKSTLGQGTELGFSLPTHH
ncbi:tetratricopeptide repeat protein [Mucilaginibacter mali]|uniref:histidine kinase n=1 Tax=Mucilaginibacter mali TaxID=2740462 RepID=A0A7D4Q2V1_9SPHI|nr:tetratricopeptide repeat protein [Mucilaginibacter mali]QKJ31646.1 tetratricopeptide repeat protein [Mucilaginibacter mali]